MDDSTATTWRAGRAPDRAGVGPPLLPVKVGQYRILDSIGRGAFGHVLTARDEVLEREVAVKLVPLEVGKEADPEVLLAEAKTLARLDHPHIVPVYAAGLESGFMWMALKRIEGRDLHSVLREERSLGLESTLSLARQMLSALAHAHELGVLHQDIKPHNVLIESSGPGREIRAWLTDFGLAAAFLRAESEIERIPAGTYGYMAPEQHLRRGADGRADLFSLGCLLVRALTGRRAFGGPSSAEIRKAVLHEEPAGLGEIAQLHGKELSAFIRQLLAKSPADRFRSAEQALGWLDSWATLEEPKSWLRRLALSFTRPKPRPWDGRYAVEMRDVHQRYSWRKAGLRGVDLALPAGAVLGLAGRNGTGKSTLLRIFAGLCRADRGVVRVLGRDPWKQRLEVLPRLGYVPETPTVPEYIRVSELLKLLESSYPSWDKRYAYRLLEILDLPFSSRIGSLSRGQKTQLQLLAGLGHRPEILFLDDPILGLDIVVLDSFLSVLDEIVREAQVSVLLASHNHAEFETRYSHLALLEKGEVVLVQPVEALRARIRHAKLKFASEVPHGLRALAGFNLTKAEGPVAEGILDGNVDPKLERKLAAFGPLSLEVKKLGLPSILLFLVRQLKDSQQ